MLGGIISRIFNSNICMYVLEWVFNVHNDRHWLHTRIVIIINGEDDSSNGTTPAIEGYATTFVWNFFLSFWRVFKNGSQIQSPQPPRMHWLCLGSSFFSSFLLDTTEKPSFYWLLSRNRKCDILRCTQCPPYSCTHYENELTAHKSLCVIVCVLRKHLKWKRKLKKKKNETKKKEEDERERQTIQIKKEKEREKNEERKMRVSTENININKWFPALNLATNLCALNYSLFIHLIIIIGVAHSRSHGACERNVFIAEACSMCCSRFECNAPVQR